MYTVKICVAKKVLTVSERNTSKHEDDANSSAFPVARWILAAAAAQLLGKVVRRLLADGGNRFLLGMSPESASRPEAVFKGRRSRVVRGRVGAVRTGTQGRHDHLRR